MSALRLVLLQELLSRAPRISRRTWLVIAGVTAGAVGLAAWAAIALTAAVWSQLPQATEAGKRMLETATQGLERVAPELTQGAAKVLGAVGEHGVGEVPAADVSGTDFGPVGRYPGLIRVEFFRDATTAMVRYVGYVGQAPMPSVLAHYTNGFARAGYAHEVLSAASGHERHRFSPNGGGPAYELSLDRRDGGLLSVTLTQVPASTTGGLR